MIKTRLQIPHAFQQQLSHKKVPTLCNAIPCYEALAQHWEEYQVSHPETYDIIEKGLKKMAEYKNCMDLVPAYVLAMGK